MRVILSRKGFDSGAGGVANPILPDGRPAVLPIPSARDPHRYRDLFIDGRPLAPVVESLTGGRVRGIHCCHLDPDLDAGSCERSHPFQPAFGQTGAASRHLINRSVEEGDLFLFFGWFRETVERDGRLRYASGAPDRHLIYGWMQADRLLRGEELEHALSENQALQSHPHAQERRLANPLNTIVVPRDRLTLFGRDTGLPGSGTFSTVRDPLVLSAPGRSRTWWKLPDFMHPETGTTLSYHEDPARWFREEDGLTLKSAARGQEFVLDVVDFVSALEWLAGIFECDF